MFERFTDRARRVVVLAQEEARGLNHNYIGTEHILLGLIHEGEGVASKALESLGISLEAVREQVQEIIGQGQQAPTGHIPFTPRAKKVLELSLREALQLGHNYIGTEHILLGLIREGEGVAAQVLVKLGADLSRVRQQVIQLISGYQGGKEGAAQGAGATQGGPADHRIELAIAGRLGEVPAELIQHGRTTRGRLRTRGARRGTGCRGLLLAALGTGQELDHGLTNLLELGAELLEHLGGHALTLADQAEEDVLGADVVVIEPPCLLLGEHDDATSAVGEPFEHGATPDVESPRC